LLMGEFSRGDDIEVAVSTTEKEKLEFRVLSATPQAS
jgi:ATP-dependent Clp protease ATP-binding subunit ClpC